jgi:ketosteroid isomerase-like protein
VSEKSVAQRAAEVVERSQRALARGDVEGYVACFAPDAELSDPGVPPMKGHAGIRQGISALMQMFSKLELLELKLFPVERSVAFKATVRFVTRNGKELTMESIDVFDLNEDFLISRGKAYWDFDYFMKQMQGA